MRRIDLHAYPGTREWIDSQGPFVEALAKYWGRAWEPAKEEDVVRGFTDASVEVVLVAFDIETVVEDAPPCTNDYVAAFRLMAIPAVLLTVIASLVLGLSSKMRMDANPSCLRPVIRRRPIRVQSARR